jgi:UDP-glucose 4-epimerase
LERIIITGGTGFIGKHLVNRLLNCGKYSIALVSNTKNFDSGNFGRIRPEKNLPLRFYSADIRDKDQISEIFRDERADTCIHLAAKISVSDSIRNPDETLEINVNGTVNVLEASHNTAVNNFVFASSAAVYGDVTELPISENQVLKPLSPYGTSKMLAEQHVSSYGRLKKIENTISLRIFNVYGVGQTSESDVITKFAIRLSKNFPPIIYGDGKHTRDFISVHDVTEAMLAAVRAMEARRDFNNMLDSSTVFNLGIGKPVSIGQLARKMIDMFGLDLEPIYKPLTDSGVILHSYADITKARELLNFVPKFGIDDGLREIVKTANSSK